MKAKKARKKVTKAITLFLLMLLLLTIAFNMNAGAAEMTDGAAVFSANCAACHMGGGNIVRRGKNLKPRALKRYGMDSIEAIAHLVGNGKNAMPAYKDRLSPQEILDVSAYVLEQAKKGWK
jgi:cytochrome c6